MGNVCLMYLNLYYKNNKKSVFKNTDFESELKNLLKIITTICVADFNN